ncbi:MAG: DUF4350 domain-containing protein [Ornithinibacter sp.]
MSATTAPAAAPTTPRGRPAWGRNRVRRTATFVAAVVLGLFLLGLLGLTAQSPTTDLDPEGTGPEGARALAEVLRQQGVEVEVVRSIGALEDAEPDADTTVFVGNPTELGPGAAARLADAARLSGRLVLAGVDTTQLEALGLPVQGFGGGGIDLVAGCDDSEVARRGDVVSVWDSRYLRTGPSEGARQCFAVPSPDGPPDQPDPDAARGSALIELDNTAAHPDTVITGLGPAWANTVITDDSHAGTAVRALGAKPRLVWYQPGTSDALAPGPGEVDSAGDPSVWPPWTAPAIALLLAAVVLLALARGRRLGRLVREPLPVVVRAIETTESRGRLYRRAGDRSRAAAVLRAGAGERLAQRLAVGRGAGPDAVVNATSRATGRPPTEVAGILFGPAPPDDAALIHLAQQLADLEERVRHP